MKDSYRVCGKHLKYVTIQPCHFGFMQLTLLTAAIAAKASIMAYHQPHG